MENQYSRKDPVGIEEKEKLAVDGGTALESWKQETRPKMLLQGEENKALDGVGVEVGELKVESLNDVQDSS